MLKLDKLATDLIGPISLDVAFGECLGVSGPSGSGKSLFLRAIADLDPSRGDVLLAGVSREDMMAPDWRKQVVLVPADAGWWADDVASHFQERTPELIEFLEAVGLPRAFDWTVARLSTGERQRLALVRALVLKPRVLLLDEPTGALDPGSTVRTEHLIRDFVGNGGAVLLTSHEAEQLDRLCGRQGVMHGGRLSVPVA